MKWSQSLRHLWHEIYYSLVKKKGVDFAIRCQAVAGEIDVSSNRLPLKNRLRVLLHLSLCQTCTNYAAFSKILKAQMKGLLKKQTATKSYQQQTEELNKKLIQLYVPRNQSKNP